MVSITAPRPPLGYVPANYTDLFRRYYGHVYSLVRKFGIDAQNAEDVAMTILTKFYEKNALADYRPDHVTHHGGVERTTSFTTFLSGFVVAYVRYHKQVQETRRRREPLLCDAPAEAQPSMATWLDFHGPLTEQDHGDLEHALLVRAVSTHLRTVKAPIKGDLATLFDAIVEQVSTDGVMSVDALAARFEVSPNSIRNWIIRLRAEIADVLDR